MGPRHYLNVARKQKGAGQGKSLLSTQVWIFTLSGTPFAFVWLILETGLHSVTQTDLKLSILLL